MDAWILVKNIESNGERNRGLYVLKARGIAHSNQVREFLLTDHGIELIDAYVGTEGVLMGSARASQSAREHAGTIEREQARQRKQRELQRKQELYEAQVMALKHQFEADRDAILQDIQEDQSRESVAATQRIEMARLRHADLAVEVDENGSRKKSRKGTVR
jgi:circadian clock protein KaiC